MASEEVIIRRVRRDGTVDVLGRWLPSVHKLELEREGFPLAGVGSHPVDGDLPWVFDEIAPDGFLGQRFAAWFPELSLPRVRADWSAAQVLAAITRRGHDLAGNLVVGEESYQRYQQIFAPPRQPGPSRDEAFRHYPDFVDQVLRDPIGSSVGGSRPKFALRLDDGQGLIVKFTPPLETEAGRRWADLLRMEAHAADVLAGAGLDAVQARYLERGNRGFLEIDRFDRTAAGRGGGSSGGRVGHVTLYYLGLARYGEVADVAGVVRSLVTDGVLDARDAARFARVHDFSRAIGNTDAHLGNYGLLIDDAGQAVLAPAYDVVPMAFAPRHDELPDRYLVHAPAPEENIEGLVQRYVSDVTADDEISQDFKAKWLATVA